MTHLIGEIIIGWWGYCLISLFVFLCSDAKVRFLYKPFDGWIGFYHDNTKQRLYILPIPFVGFVVMFGVESQKEHEGEGR